MEAHGIESVAVLGGGTMGGGIAGYLAARGPAGRARRRLARARRAGARAAARAHARATSTRGCCPPRRPRRPRAWTTPPDLEAAVGDADLVIEAVPEEQALKEDVLGRCSAAAPATRDHRLQHLLAADRRARRRRSASRRASSACTGSTRRSGRPGSRSSPPPGRAARPSSASIAFLRDDRQAPGRGRRPRGLRLQPAPDGAAARGARDRGRGPGDAREPRRGRAQHVRLPPAVLRPVPDRGHGRARHLRERVRDARARASGPEFAVPGRGARARRGRAAWARRAGRASATTPRPSASALLLERDRRYAALAKLLAEPTKPVDVCGSRPAPGMHLSRQGT